MKRSEGGARRADRTQNGVLASGRHIEATAGQVKSLADSCRTLWRTNGLVGCLQYRHRGCEIGHAAAVIDFAYGHGTVEGCMNRIEILKRQVYGLARFELVHRR